MADAQSSTDALRVVQLHRDPATRDIAHRRIRAFRVRRERSKHRRQRVEEKIAAALELLEDLRASLIAGLDELHGDPDLEPGCDDEETLPGYFIGRGRQCRYIDDAEADIADDEPELGSQEGGPGGTLWGRASQIGDLGGEETCEDEGAQCEGGGGDERY